MLLFVGTLALCVAIGVGSLFAWKYVIQSGARSVASPFGPSGGRYYAFPYRDVHIVVIDTETGHCWDWNSSAYPSGSWQDLGAPKWPPATSNS